MLGKTLRLQASRKRSRQHSSRNKNACDLTSSRRDLRSTDLNLARSWTSLSSPVDRALNCFVTFAFQRLDVTELPLGWRKVSAAWAEMTPRRPAISYSIMPRLCVCIDGEEATQTPARSLSFLFLSAALSLKCLFNQHGTCFKIKRGALVTPNGGVSASDALSGFPLSPPAKANALQISYISQTISPTRYAVRCLLEDHWLPLSDTCARLRWRSGGPHNRPQL